MILKQSWHFDGHLFVVKALNGTKQPSSISMWVRALDISPNFQTPAVIKSITTHVAGVEGV